MKEARQLVCNYDYIQKGYAHNCNAIKKQVQAVIDHYNKMGFYPLENIADVHELFSDLETFIFHKQTGGGAKVMTHKDERLNVNTNVAKTLFAKPAGYFELQNEIGQFKKCLQHGAGTKGMPEYVQIDVNSIRTFFAYNDGILSFSQQQTTKIDEIGNVYTYTEIGKARLAFLEEVGKSLAKHGDKMRLGMGHEIDLIPAENICKIIAKCISGVNRRTGKITANSWLMQFSGDDAD